MDLTQILLMALCGMMAVLVAIVGWWGNGVGRKLDVLTVHKENCIAQFADKTENTDSHQRIWAKLSSQQTELHGQNARLVSLEQRGKGRDNDV